MSQEQENDDLRTQLESAFAENEEIKEPSEPTEVVVEPSEDPVEPAPAGESEPEKLDPISPPNSLRPEIKEKWETLPRDVQEEWVKRESDIERMMTHPSGELALGRQFKETITPYMPLIKAAGLEPTTAVSNLLNSEYILRTADPETKIGFAKQLLKDYGIDAKALVDDSAGEQDYQDPVISQLLDKINKLEQQTNPQYLQNILQEQKQRDTISQEWQAFSANPANAYVKEVFADMQTLLSGGRASNYQEAYDMACWANPAVRAKMLQSQQKELEDKRRQEVAQKRVAASSISGSPATPSGNSQGKSNMSVRESILAALAEAESSTI